MSVNIAKKKGIAQNIGDTSNTDANNADLVGDAPNMVNATVSPAGLFVPTNSVRRPTSRAALIAMWVCRVCFLAVFVVNVQCALGFILFPQNYLAAYQLSGEVGAAALQGLGVAFLMWNATYPLVIINPKRFKVLGWVVLVQQLIGLIGESWIVASLAYSTVGASSAFSAAASSVTVASTATLQASLMRFISFDVLGLCLMGGSFLTLQYLLRRYAH